MSTSLRVIAADSDNPSFTNAVVLSIAHPVEARRYPAQVWDRAYTNQVLNSGDSLRTGRDARALLRLSNLTDFPVGESTQLELPRRQDNRVVIRILRGIIYFFHRDRPGEFQVDTPTVSAVVRGTEFAVQVEENGSSTFRVLDGRNDPEGYFFYIMELGDDKLGRQPIEPFTYSPNTLAAMLDGGRLSVQACLRLGLDLTAALQYLHEQQLIHRDIKPSNIVFVNRQPKFADIGLVTDVAPRGKDVSLVGTEGYIPPEGPGTISADLYGLGKVLYEGCSGQDRNQFPSLSRTLIASADPLFNRFNEIILKACHSEPGQRYQSASEFHTDLLGLSRRL